MSNNKTPLSESFMGHVFVLVAPRGIEPIKRKNDQRIKEGKRIRKTNENRVNFLKRKYCTYQKQSLKILN
jgi:hypothetical protein